MGLYVHSSLLIIQNFCALHIFNSILNKNQFGHKIAKHDIFWPQTRPVANIENDQVFNQKLFHGPDHTLNWVGVQGGGSIFGKFQGVTISKKFQISVFLRGGTPVSRGGSIPPPLSPPQFIVWT